MGNSTWDVVSGPRVSGLRVRAHGVLAIVLAMTLSCAALSAAEELKPISLAGTWRFDAVDEERNCDPGLDDSKWREVTVPGKLTEQGLQEGNGWYRRRFALTKEAAGRDLVLDSLTVDGSLWVYAAGRRVGWSVGSARRGAFLVPGGLLREGENVLAIRVASRNGIEGGEPRLRLPEERRNEKQALLFDYLKRSADFSVTMPPLLPGKAQSVPVSLGLIMHESANPLLDGAELDVVLKRKNPPGAQDKPGVTWADVVRRKVKLAVGEPVNVAFELAPEDAVDYCVAVQCLDGEPLSQQLVTHDLLRPALPRFLTDPYSCWLKNREGNLVCLFVGKGPDYAKAAIDKKRPVVVGLVSEMLWDDYYLPRNRRDNFVARFCDALPGGATYVDASFRGLPLLALAELDRSVLAAAPDIIIISIGEHEHSYSPSAGDCETSVNAIVDRLRAHTTARLVFVTPPPSLKDPVIRAPYDGIMRRAAERTNAPLVDTAKLFAGAEGGLEANYDRLAPNARLHDLVAREIGKAFTRKAIGELCKRAEYVRNAVPAGEGKALTLVANGKWPATNTVSGNTLWQEIGGERFHAHKAGDGQSEHDFTGHPFGFGLLYKSPPVPSEHKPSPAAENQAGECLLSQVVLIPEDSSVKSFMLVLLTAEFNRDAQGINYLHEHSWDHGVYWGEDTVSYGKGRPPQAHVRGGDLPAKGKPVVLEVSAEALELKGRLLLGAKFVTVGGPVSWGSTTVLVKDKQGKTVESARWVKPDAERECGRFLVTAGRGMDWQWTAPPGGEGPWGARCHRSVDPSDARRYGVALKTPVPFADGAVLRQWVYLPPEERPDRIGISLNGGATCYWGRLLVYDEHEQTQWRYAGPMPQAGAWTRLEVAPSELLGPGARLTQMSFFAQTGAALWGKTEVTGVAAAFEAPEDFLVEYPTGPYDLPVSVSTGRMGNHLFEGQTPDLAVCLNNPAGQQTAFRAAAVIEDARGAQLASVPIEAKLAPESVLRVPVACPRLERGFYRVIVKDPQGRTMCETSMSMLPLHANFRDKQVFVYSNTGYVWEEMRLYDVLGGKWCRFITPQQDTHRIETFDTSPVNGQSAGTDPVMDGYRTAVANARRKTSTQHHVQYWFNISSDEMNLNWHNYERWSEVIKAVTVGLKQGDPNCIVSTPEVNSIAMGMVDKLGENHTYDYLDLFFSTGCSLPVPPECTNKYWAFDLDSLHTIQEKYGRTISLTGMQYSTGNIGRAWGNSEEHQAAYYVRGDLLRRARGIDYISYFKFRESPNVNIYEVKDAITHTDITPKPAFVALCNNFAVMDGSRYLGQLRLGAGAHAYLFDRPGGRGMVLALWSTEPVPQKTYLDLHAATVRVTDLYGKQRALPTRDGLAAIEYSGDVIYVEGVGEGILQETFFEPALIPDKRALARKDAKPVFACIENNRTDTLNLGDSRRSGRGDFVITAGAEVPVRVNVYNLSAAPGVARVRLSVPRGLECAEDTRSLELAARSCANHTFRVRVPLDAPTGLGRFTAGGEFRPNAAAPGAAQAIALDSFASDVLVRSPLEVLPVEAPLPAGGAGNERLPATLKVRFANAGKAPLDAAVRLDVPPGWQLKSSTTALKNVAPGQDAVAQFELIAAEAKPFQRYAVTASAQVGQALLSLESDLDFTTVMRCTRPPVIDGKLDDWPDSAPLFAGQRSNDYIYNQLSQILDKEDYSLRVRTMWDDENLYLALDVWDDYICCEDTKHGLLWDLDSQQVSFDLNGDGKMDRRFSISPQGRSYIVPEDPRSDREPMITGSQGLIDMAAQVYLHPTGTRPAGYVVETAIPWEWFGTSDPPRAPFREGAKLGLHLFAVDEDRQAWSARPWKFDEGHKEVFVPLTLVRGAAALAAQPGGRAALQRKVFSRSPGDIAASETGGEAGLVFEPYTAGEAERFPTTPLDLPNRSEAGRLWFFGPGCVEYAFPVGRFLDTVKGGAVESVEVVAELASCYRPGNTHYAVPGNATRVTVSIADLTIGEFDVLGDPGVDGFLLRLCVTDGGTLHAGRRVSQVNIEDLLPRLTGDVRVRFAAKGLGGNRGGLNVHGLKGSGIHGADPALVIRYRKAEAP